MRTNVRISVARPTIVPLGSPTAELFLLADEARAQGHGDVVSQLGQGGPAGAVHPECGRTPKQCR